MKISNIGNNTSIAKKGNSKKTTESSFASHLSSSDEASNTTSTPEVSATIPVNSLFALQEVGDEQSSRKKEISRGFDMVEYLDEIRVGLLTGEVPISVLNNLDSLVKQWRESDYDTDLEEIINEIELRAAVEIAKLEKA